MRAQPRLKEVLSGEERSGAARWPDVPLRPLHDLVRVPARVRAAHLHVTAAEIERARPFIARRRRSRRRSDARRRPAPPARRRSPRGRSSLTTAASARDRAGASAASALTLSVPDVSYVSSHVVKVIENLCEYFFDERLSARMPPSSEVRDVASECPLRRRALGRADIAARRRVDGVCSRRAERGAPAARAAASTSASVARCSPRPWRRRRRRGGRRRWRGRVSKARRAVASGRRRRTAIVRVGCEGDVSDGGGRIGRAASGARRRRRRRGAERAARRRPGGGDRRVARVRRRAARRRSPMSRAHSCATARGVPSHSARSHGGSGGSATPAFPATRAHSRPRARSTPPRTRCSSRAAQRARAVNLHRRPGGALVAAAAAVA